MSYYSPDKWVVLKVPAGYKVLGGWSGGYLDGSAWRLNSGITRVEEKLDWRDEKYLVFYGHSGSEYWCHPKMYGFNNISSGVYNSLNEMIPDMVELLPEDTDWLNMKWEIE
jgi:hypothetical protein